MRGEDQFLRTVGVYFDHLIDVFPRQVRILNLVQLFKSFRREDVDVYMSTLEYLIREGMVVGRPVADHAPLFANVGLTGIGVQLVRPWQGALRSALQSGEPEPLNSASEQFLTRP